MPVNLAVMAWKAGAANRAMLGPQEPVVAWELRQAAEEFSAAVADALALAERVRLLQEELLAQLNEQTSRTLFVLTVVTVLALPINLIAGLFGMNVGGIPFSAHGHGFLVVVTVAVSLTALLAFLAYRTIGPRRDR